MKYEIHIVPSAEREMDKLPAAVHTRISRRILSLEDNPRPRAVKKPSGRQEYRLRVVIIEFYTLLMTIDAPLSSLQWVTDGEYIGKLPLVTETKNHEFTEVWIFPRARGRCCLLNS